MTPYVPMITIALQGVLFSLAFMAIPSYEEGAMHATNHDFGMVALAFAMVAFIDIVLTLREAE